MITHNSILIVPIKVKLLEEMLKFPDIRKIAMVRQSWEDMRNGQLELLIESPDELQAVPFGASIPIGTIQVKVEFCTHCNQSHVVESTLQEF